VRERAACRACTVYVSGAQCRKRARLAETVSEGRGRRSPTWSPDAEAFVHAPRRHPSNRPFMAAPRTQFYHPAAAIDAGLHAIERAIRRAEGVALVVGQPGTGKSLLLAKIAEQVRDDFDVAFLSGTRILTRRSLWQSILAEIGEPYRGIDEVELRMAIVERIRGLAAAGSGLVIMVDEAHTLPTRLIEELRLLTNIPTPLPAVHIVLAGGPKLEELLGLPRMESLAQRIVARAYLEPLDHAETMAYLRALPKAAGLEWDRLFGPGCDDAVFAATDGVPRLVNQICDHALVIAAAAGRPATPADVAAAWREIQKLPAPAVIERAAPRSHDDAFAPPAPATDRFTTDDDLATGVSVIEFGSLDDEPGYGAEPAGDADSLSADTADMADLPEPVVEASNPWKGPDVELVGEGASDPFEEYFSPGAERGQTSGADPRAEAGPGECARVSSREGEAIARLLADFERAGALPLERVAAEPRTARENEQRHRDDPRRADVDDADDSDMILIEDDVDESPSVFAVRPGDYRRLFTRLRRGDR
jgi:type II secretory pathway predicted ATPase ExeA